MKINRLRLEHVRQFRNTFQIDDLEAGLNLFAGPNESGKSTIVAAIRAAFFERHRSSSVDHLRPWGDSTAAPSVEIDFEHEATSYNLRKSFLSKKRCELRIGTQLFDGVEAEDRIADLLGFSFAGRGASTAEHWGIPGLLWIEQGAAQEVRSAVGNATDHLRTALNASVGEVASSGGDDVVATIETQRNALLTQSAGKPRGDYLAAIEQQAALSASLNAIATDIESYRTKVDRLAALREAHARDEAGQPWLGFRAQQTEASNKLEAIRGIAQALAANQQRAQQAEGRGKLLRDQLANFEAQQNAARVRESESIASARELDEANTQFAQWVARRLSAVEEHQHARDVLRHARQEATRRSHQQQLTAIRDASRAAAEALGKAEAEHAKLQAAQIEVATNEIKAADLKALRQQHTALRELQIQQEAVATRLSFHLDAGQRITIGSEEVSGDGERRLLAATSIQLPGIGQIGIAPGGTDLSELHLRASELADRHRALLQRLGLSSFDAAEARQKLYSERLADLRTIEATLDALAANGIDALRHELLVLRTRANEIENALRELPPAEPAFANLPAIANAESIEESTRIVLTQIEASLQQAQIAASMAQSKCEASARELANARVILEAPDRAERLAGLQNDLLETRAELATLGTRIEAHKAELEQARPEIIEQDVERFRRSADQHEKQHRDRREELLRLEVELEAAGARGLDERGAEIERDLAQARRRRDELERRASALDLLLELLREKRSALTRRLQAPLQRHLDRYLQLLFAQASLVLDDRLVPGDLIRTNGADSESSPFDALSFGAREQMGIISRLAYADLLLDAGRPTLIILDDALVHSDDMRLGRMKRLLFDAATRHQILLFTCHADKWRDMGVVARNLEAMRGAA